MKTSTPAAESELRELFVDQLRDILWAEKHILKALPKMARTASSPQLESALAKHQKETETHVERLEEIFQMLSLSPRAKKCAAMEGLLEEGDEIATEYADSPAVDAALIAAAQKVEHYEIATYGTLRAFAKQLGLAKIATLLGKTLEEESHADETLTRIAEAGANATAAEAA